mmetsp:Transcript_3596/g.8210  ORF Transcript_3596/g.8210 Transcript_3596/m.8210 type:complete len:844 (+) Transcript_3596:184-2715(+)
MSYQAEGVLTAHVSTLNQEQNQGPERLFQILEDAVIKPDEALLMNAEELKNRHEIIDQAWDKVRKWLWANESQDRRAAAAYIRGNGEVTCLHLMCKLNDPPAELVGDLIDAAPEVASFADTHGWLPLHHACANGASTDVLEILINAYPESKLIQDNQNRTPLHFYATRNTDNPEIMTRNVRLLCDSGAAELSDRGGMLPMHYACAYGSNAEVLKVLADAFPESLTTKDNKGKTPMHLTMVNGQRDTSPDVLKFLLDTAGRETVNLRDTEGNLPLHLLNLGLRGVDLDSDGEKLTNASECLRIYLAAKPKASADFLAEIQELPGELLDVAVVSPHVRRILNNKIVRRFPTSVVMMDLFMYMLLIIAFEVASTHHIEVRFQTTVLVEETILETLFRYGLFVGSGYFLLRELTQLAALVGLGLGLGSWVYDTTNWLDVVVVSMVGTFAALMTDPRGLELGGVTADLWGLDNKSFRAGCAFTKMVLWVAVVYFLKSLSINFAVFLDGVVYVVKRLVAFLMAVACILVAFALMFAILYQEEEMCDEEIMATANLTHDGCEPSFPHCSIEFSLLKAYSMMMGEIGSETRYDGIIMAQILYILYAFFVVILLSNVLIAIVTDSYEFIQNDRAAIVFWTNRLDFVAETDGMSSIILGCCGLNSSTKGAAGAPTRVQERPGGTQILDGDDDDENENKEIMWHIWSSVTGLFTEAHFYEDEKVSFYSIEFWVFAAYQCFALLVVIPVWVVLGVVTVGILWPPQVREYMLLQSETGQISQQSRERQKLEQLREIQGDIAQLKVDIQKEIEADRSDMARMKMDVENVQSEVLSDLQQIKELMTTLLDLGGMAQGM